MSRENGSLQGPGSVAIISFIPDYGHLQPLLKIADALREAGFDIKCYIAYECSPLMNRFKLNYFTLDKTSWPERRKSLAKIFARGIFFNAVCLYIHYLTLYPSAGEAVGRAAVKLKQDLSEFRPDLIICDGLWFVDWYTQIAALLGVPLIVNSFDGSLAYNQRDFVKIFGITKVTPALQFLTEVIARISKKLCTIFYRIRYPGRWLHLRTVRTASKLKFDAEFPVPRVATTPVEWIVVGTAAIERDRLGALIRQVGADWREFPPIRFRSRAPLPETLYEWIRSDAQLPIIYISFGSAVELDAALATAVYEGVRELPARVLWSLPEDQQALLSNVHPAENIRFETFVPQAEILDLPTVRCFITQAGPHSVQEALFGGTPMLCIPYFVDQAYNGSLVEHLGVGKRLWRGEVSARAVCVAVQELLSNNSYLETALEIKRDIIGRDGGIQIARYVSEVVQTSQMRRCGRDLSQGVEVNTN